MSLIVLSNCFFFFFFSSRRRHTRSLCDWSSDVCSSDLPPRQRFRIVQLHHFVCCVSQIELACHTHSCTDTMQIQSRASTSLPAVRPLLLCGLVASLYACGGGSGGTDSGGGPGGGTLAQPAPTLSGAPAPAPAPAHPASLRGL